MGLRSLRGLAVIVVIGLAVVACDPADVVETPSPAASATPSATDAAEAILLAPWRPAPLLVPDNLVESARYVCVNQEDEAIKVAVENLPVVLADAHGAGLMSLIFADEFAAFECRLKLEMVGEGLGATIIAGPFRLAPDSTTPVEEDGIKVVSHTRIDDESGPRTILIGRVGPTAYSASVGFNDESWITASKAEGWFYVWWPGNKEPGAIVSADRKSVVLQSAPTPEQLIEGRIGPASWWIAPAALPLDPKLTVIPAQVRERACAGGRSPEGRILDPQVFSGQDGVLVTFWIRLPDGVQDCQGNPDIATLIQLPDPIGERKLLDGSEIPPRDASVLPD